jgi:hypothetical protein
MGIGLKSGLSAVITTLLFVSTSAQAQSILYRNDYTIGTDYVAAALAAGSFSVTSTSGDLSLFNLSDFDAVIYANQNSGLPGGDLASLNGFVSGGGRVIFSDWTQTAGFLGDFAYTGTTNQTSLFVESALDGGIANPLAISNPGWGTFSFGLTPVGGTLGGTFGNGQGAIVIGNGGRTIVNGFLTDTVASSQLYSNQLGQLFGVTAAVPEPATWAMMLLGFGFVGGAMRSAKRRQKLTVSYA